MRVCIVSQEYPPGYVGGIGTQSRVKAQGLAALGHDVSVVTAGDEDGEPIVVWEDGPVCVHEIRTPGGEFPVYRTETYWLGYTWAVLGALRALSEPHPFDVIDFPDYSAEGLAFQLDRQDDDRTAVVVHLHGSLSMFTERIGWPARDEPLHRLGTTMEGLSIGAADRLLAASRSIAEFTSSRHDLRLEDIDVVEGAVDTDAFTPARSALDAGARSAVEAEARGAERPVRMLFVGSVAENKGVRTVFDAFVRLAPAHPELSLTVAGSGDEEIAESMSADAARLGLSDRFELLGFVEHRDLPATYRSADLLAAPSQYEGGLGMVYLEAMACGLPVIAAAAGGAREAIVPWETGVLLERGDVDDLCAAVRALLDDAGLRQRLGAAGRARVVSRFAIGRYAERVAAAYERAVEHRRASVVTW